MAGVKKYLGRLSLSFSRDASGGDAAAGHISELLFHAIPRFVSPRRAISNRGSRSTRAVLSRYSKQGKRADQRPSNQSSPYRALVSTAAGAEVMNSSRVGKSVSLRR